MSIFGEIAGVFTDAARVGMERAIADGARDFSGFARKRFHRNLVGTASAISGIRGGSDEDNARDPSTGMPIWLSKLLTQDWGSYLILGERGQGKTTLCLAIGEFRAEYAGARTFMLDAPPHLQANVVNVETMEECKSLPIGSTLIIDDAAAYIGSRRSGAKSNLEFMDIIFTARHRQLTLLINAQTSASVDRYALTTNAVFQKFPVAFWDTIERPEMKPTIERAMAGYSGMSDEQRKGVVYVAQPNTTHEGWISYEPPAYYTTEASRFRTGQYGTSANSRPIEPEEDHRWAGY